MDICLCIKEYLLDMDYTKKCSKACFKECQTCTNNRPDVFCKKVIIVNKTSMDFIFFSILTPCSPKEGMTYIYLLIFIY